MIKLKRDCNGVWNDLSFKIIQTKRSEKKVKQVDNGQLDGHPIFRRAIFDHTSVFDLWSRPWGVARLLCFRKFFQALIPYKPVEVEQHQPEVWIATVHNSQPNLHLTSHSNKSYFLKNFSGK